MQRNCKSTREENVDLIPGSTTFELGIDFGRIQWSLPKEESEEEFAELERRILKWMAHDLNVETIQRIGRPQGLPSQLAIS